MSAAIIEEDKKGPVEFELREAQAVRRDGEIVVDCRTQALGFLLRMNEQTALNLAHDIERAYHQRHA